MSKGKKHHYEISMVWTGATEGPAKDYHTYSREHRFEAPGKPPLIGSADPAFRGDAGQYNPEELLLAALSGCHMLWYLHLCTAKKITVVSYEDHVEGMMTEEPRAGRFVEATIKPTVTIAAGDDVALAVELHERAHSECFIANSVNFPIHCEPTIQTQD
ncbi:MAG: OsmC family peroxiredoxin [Alphaproteobacteria bacterium]|nr:OsmC family peroxiredoxin [Alphaproteobacteria bacterium]